jgi:quinoprotein glucose dehydrogenase
MQRIRKVVPFVACLLLMAATGRAENLDWPSYGSDPGSSKYSPLSQIDASTVKQLTVAWQWESADNSIARAGKARPFGYKVTPIMIDDVLYVSTSLGQVAAIDALTGEQMWVFDTAAWEQGRPTNLGFNHRGVAYWSDGKSKRVLMPTNDAHLWSIDAVTGKPDLEFGELGKVDLTLGLGREVNRRHYSVISAPTIVNGTVVVGSSISDGPRQKEMPPGHVRGFDVRDGKQKWIFHTIPQQGEAGVETWEGDSWKYSGNTNVWTLMSADPDLGYVYLPTGTPTNDWYGGHRLGDNLFAESLICVDAATGERVWHFQMVHHGLWDYDLPAAPNLVDINVDGKVVKAVAQVSKQGFVYVFNRVTGEPIWPIVETAVAASTVPGEKASPTQPIPSKPAAFDHQGISDDVLIDFSAELKKAAWEIVENYEHGPLFTPPSLKGTINLPGWGGGANWSGAAFDPQTHMLYVPSTTYPMVVKLQASNPERSNFNYRRSREVSRISGPEGLPLTRPPYARITAIDLDTGEHAWMVPNGEGKRVRDRVKALGLPDPGWVGESGSTGPLLTGTLLFIAHRGGGNPVLRAYDKSNGELVHEVALPARPYGTPMTYMSKGKQHISIAVGEMDSAGILTLALP